MGWFLDTAVACGVLGLAAGAFLPSLIARLPEPQPEPEPHLEVPPGFGAATAGAPVPGPAKERYDAIAALPGLRTRTALATGAAAALVGARTGWEPQLSFLLYLCWIGVALGLVDWRTRLLPTRLIAPSYPVVVALVGLSAWLDGDWHRLVAAGWGWLLAGGTFFALWFVHPRGMGYGDVRLSGVLGIALGYGGWGRLLTGVYAGFLIGAVAGLLLSALRIVDSRAYPFGPFMLVGALVGVLAGPAVTAWYA